MGLHKLPYYVFLGYTGLIAVLCVLLAPMFDLAPGVGWCVLAGSYLVFFLSTIEQPQVKCEWAGWILGPGALLVALAGVDIMNVVDLLWGLAAVVLSTYIGLTENVPSLAKYDRQHLGHLLEIIFIPPRHRHPKSSTKQVAVPVVSPDKLPPTDMRGAA